MNPLKVLAERIHPIFGNPVFAGVTSILFGGFFTFTRNSAMRDKAILEKLGKDDPMAGHRVFIRRESVDSQQMLDPKRHYEGSQYGKSEWHQPWEGGIAKPQPQQ